MKERGMQGVQDKEREAVRGPAWWSKHVNRRV